MRDSGLQVNRGRHWICALCAACLLCLLATGGYSWRAWRVDRRGIERPLGKEVEQRPGINVQLEQYVGEAAQLDAALADIASLGFYWVRQRFPWQAIEPAPGVYDWGRWDALVEAVARHDLALIAVLEAPPSWALSSGRYPLPCEPPCQVDTYARFVSAFAQRYGEVIDRYQIWDEPNLSRSWGGGHVHPCGYVRLLEAAYLAIHAADPSAWVLGGGLAPTQAPGPDNLNEWVYLRHLYALGGRGFFDVLAVKPYGFWSGPEDRRVDTDVLNYSRVIAQRELMRARGDGDKPVWAVEWGWNVLPEGWSGEHPPWGSDTSAVQAPRIRAAMDRARVEWPWMGVLCWAEYQPAVPPVDPRWGFALRDPAGAPTALYPLLRVVNDADGSSTRAVSFPNDLVSWERQSAIWALFPLYAIAALAAASVWRRCAGGAAVRRLRRWWSSLAWPVHLATLMALVGLYTAAPRLAWVVLACILAALVLYDHPRWALVGAAFCIPLIYVAKLVNAEGEVLDIPPAELLTWLAIMVAGARCARALTVRGLGTGARLWLSRVRVGWSPLDTVWMSWVALGALSPLIAPDPASAWREWRLVMLGPVVLYFLMRSGVQETSDSRERGQRNVLLAWLTSGVAVALVGVAQWIAGALVQAGDVGRVTGVYYSPNHLALYLERVWPLMLTLAVYGGLGKRWRLAAWAGVAVLSLTLYLTFSRAAWGLAIPLSLLVVGVSYRRRLCWWAAGLVAMGVLLAAGSVLLRRSTSLVASPRAVLLSEVRIPVWQSTLQMIGEHPWMGVGLDGFRFVYPRYMRVASWTEPLLYHPHNVWLDAAVRLGLPGLAVFVLLIAGSVREIGCLVQRSRQEWVLTNGGREAALRRAVAVGCLAGIGAGLAHGMVDSGYFVTDLAWSLALVVGLLAGPRGCSQKDAGAPSVGSP